MAQQLLLVDRHVGQLGEEAVARWRGHLLQPEISRQRPWRNLSLGSPLLLAPSPLAGAAEVAERALGAISAASLLPHEGARLAKACAVTSRTHGGQLRVARLRLVERVGQTEHRGSTGLCGPPRRRRRRRRWNRCWRRGHRWRLRRWRRKASATGRPLLCRSGLWRRRQGLGGEARRPW